MLSLNHQHSDSPDRSSKELSLQEWVKV